METEMLLTEVRTGGSRGEIDRRDDWLALSSSIESWVALAKDAVWSYGQSPHVGQSRW